MKTQTYKVLRLKHVNIFHLFVRKKARVSVLLRTLVLRSTSSSSNPFTHCLKPFLFLNHRHKFLRISRIEYKIFSFVGFSVPPFQRNNYPRLEKVEDTDKSPKHVNAGVCAEHLRGLRDTRSERKGCTQGIETK